MYACLIALAVYSSGPDAYGKALVNTTHITSMVQYTDPETRKERTRIGLVGGTVLVTGYAPHEVARLPCQDLR